MSVRYGTVNPSAFYLEDKAAQYLYQGNILVWPDSTPYSYTTVTIGACTWAAENAREKVFKNGDPIAYVPDPIAWQAANTTNTPAWCYVNNDPSTEAVHGILYNGWAASDARGIGPTGFRVPTKLEWTDLINCVATTYSVPTSVAARYLKSDATVPNGGWQPGNPIIPNNFDATGSSWRGSGGSWIEPVPGIPFGWISYYGTSSFTATPPNQWDAIELEYNQDIALQTGINPGAGVLIRYITI